MFKQITYEEALLLQEEDASEIPLLPSIDNSGNIRFYQDAYNRQTQ